MSWRDLDDGGVLELDTPAARVSLAIDGSRSLAWWCDDLGRFLGFARGGVA
jgi:hypothetical protein